MIFNYPNYNQQFNPVWGCSNFRVTENDSQKRSKLKSKLEGPKGKNWTIVRVETKQSIFKSNHSTRMTVYLDGQNLTEDRSFLLERPFILVLVQDS